MPIDVQGISQQQRDIILAVREDHYNDLKAIEIAPAKLTRSIASLANSDGGELYIGIAEVGQAKDRIWQGFKDVEAANGHLQIFEKLFPLDKDFQYTFLECSGEDGLVLYIQVSKTTDIKSASDGEIYIRRGAQNLRLVTFEEKKRLEYTKGLSSFESEATQVDIALLTESEVVGQFIQNVVPTVDVFNWLRKQLLIRNNYPTVAGILLFAEEPQAVLPKRCGIKIYRYKTKNIGTRESLAFQPITIEGCIYEQIHNSVEATTKVVEEMKRLGEQAFEDVVYPSEAIHEIVSNAVLHRDYSLADDIHIRIYDNRVEVESPGRLPAHITPKNILDERFARNPSIVRLINKFPDPPNKDVGEGLNTAFAAMKKIGLKEPLIDNKENSVLVVLRHEQLASPEVVIMNYLKTNDSIQNKKAREICNINEDYVVKEIFRRLTDRELIEKIDGTRTSSTAYTRGRKFSAFDQD
ncbi:ATP-binding protein [Hymenobacter terrenus]|uniref:ATP-binding protein n=1 Tax=Hymenobacter terrenus TaxID=1629124 RepID=UPI0006198E35|nr:ATP-binding protein [Hymenobacter terrenus]